ncbi:RES family NAD+ phosphorylase [Sphingosinicella terrae]|uniref:RES family NAD+ phosphorylase n=1 Tax=Sphingosinicella terrae TaxID=2172047 RepID=UPI000E0DE6CC|nr:RES domain-containing protein [Sphingosinicella terrae]
MAARHRPGLVDRVLHGFRIGDPAGKYPIFDDEGSRLYPGRWNTASTPMLYASEHYSTALLEKLVSFSAVLPANQHHIRITIPPGVSYETFDPGRHPGWDGADPSITKGYGANWQSEGRSLLLIVPSIPGGRIDRNFLINLRHPQAAQLSHDMPVPVCWDSRLFARG